MASAESSRIGESCRIKKKLKRSFPTKDPPDMSPHQVHHIIITGNQRRIYNNDFVRHLRSPQSAQPSSADPVFAQLQSILGVLKATALLPIYEQRSGHEVAPPTKGHALYSLTVRLLIYMLSLYYMYNLYVLGNNQLFSSYSETDHVNKAIEVLLCSLMFGAIIWISAKNGPDLLKILNELLSFDAAVQREFEDTSLNDNCGFASTFVIGVVGVQCYLLLLKVVAIPDTVAPTTYVLLAFQALQNALASIFMVFTASLLRLVTMRFAYLNRLLTGYTYAQQRKVPLVFMPRAGVAAGAGQSVGVRRAIDMAMASFPADSLFAYRLHNSLLCIYKAINEYSSMILVGYMGYAFYTITSTTYNLFVQITTQRHISLNEMQWSFAWLALHTGLLALLSRTCGQATKEANATSQILARVYGKNKEYQHIIDKFLTKSIRQEVHFSAYGFFIIDNSTLFKIFSAVTTYLVILIQFKQLEDSKGDEHAPTHN